LVLADKALAEWDADAAIAHLSAAARAFTADGDNRQAAMACARVGDVFANILSNRVAAQPWFRRAERLIEPEEPCIEQGWVALASLGCDINDPADLARRAELALDRARRFGDVDLEIKALADGGLARVQAGRVADGMALLDEAMALACGGGSEDYIAMGKSVCSFFTACYVTADFARVETWSPLLRQRGIIGPAIGPQAYTNSHCSSVQGIVLCHLGRWGEAEDVLLRAYADIEQIMPGNGWHPTIALAELRILQGRLTEAEALLLGRDDHLQALVPTARLYLARKDYELAAATARRGLRMMGNDRVRGASLLGVLVEAELGRGDVAQAAAASAELDARTAGLGLPLLAAEAARLRAQVACTTGDRRAAIAALQDGLDQLTGARLPHLQARLHLDLARLLDADGDRPAATVEGRAAVALLARLDVVLEPGDADVLRRLGLGMDAKEPEADRRRQLATLRRDGSWWTATCGSTSARLRHTKGLAYLAELVAHPGAERHALDLVDLVEGVSGEAGIDRRRLGDAGPLLDARSRETYRRRAAQLRDDIEDALAVEDDERAAAAQAELDALVAELSRAFGLDGQERKASSVVERARLNVTRALRAAIATVTDALPDAGPVLDRRVRTGTFCAYEPQRDDELLWTVQP
jgi:tetratricopeptide (TPR) repeat protein